MRFTGSPSGKLEERPPDRGEPDEEEKPIDDIADSDYGFEGFRDDADAAGRDAEKDDGPLEGAPEHDDRDDQDTDRLQHADGTRDGVLGDRTLGRGRKCG